ncbi:LamG domain-containing protein [Flavobacterium sp.]|uniref:LamG domain-containing protein n=1 Tax=Flavobacterium sp. TaxID=239 RepID=UPI00121C9510|nr:LamG domain-containing protein [Flavobacterium sp.]RZJ70929.1 MAG: LamG domain-containing protein [Flavobacterium sp.]
MKKFVTYFIVALAVGLGFLVSCQDEENESRQSAGLLNKTSALSQRLQNLTANNTSIDNVLDTTDCFSVKLPVQILINGESFTVDSTEDYATVAALLQQTPTGTFAEFVYPITVITRSYEEIVVNNASQLPGAVADCAGFETIGCLSVSYPISVTTYDTGSQNPSTQTLDNNQEFFLLIQNLSDSEFYEIQYPITVLGVGGAPISIASNDEFDLAMTAAVANCACANPDILIDSLIFYMPIANEIADLTGFSTPAANGGIGFVPDRIGEASGALQFVDGTPDNQIVINGNDQNDMLQNNAFTVSMWFNRTQDNFVQTPETFFQANQFSIAFDGQSIDIKSPTVIVNGAVITDQSWFDQGLGGSLNVWHHLVLTYDGQNLLLYRDANLVGQLQFFFQPGTMPPSAIGGNFPGGIIDQVRVYKKALNATEVGTLFEIANDNNTCL